MADPMLMKGMDSAVKTILAAMETRDKITIYGDYDADGLTATAVLVHFFSDLGIPVTSYVPNRLEEGYGLNGEAIEQIGRNGTGLIITVDCGISGAREIDLAKGLGLEVVVTDHHQMSGESRLNCPVINPHQPDCPFPFKDLAGVGLAFFLAVAIRAALRDQGWFKGRSEPDLREYLDLVALGTIADRVPLLGQNRMLVRGGIRRMADSRWPGIRAMMDVASVKSSEISSDDLSFRLAPRLNAPGRLGDSDAGLRILTVTEGQEAKELALKVNVANGRRQRLEQSILDRIEDMIRSEGQIADRRTLLLWGENWHQGVLGIVASRLVERYHRTSLVVGVKDGIATGSGRSIDGFNLYQALSRLRSLFHKFGGHAYAAGFRLDEENLEILKRELEGLAEKEMTEEDLVPTIDVDADLLLKEIGHEMIGQITALSPFGEKNPEPVFRARSLHVSGSRVVGERHLKLRVRQGETTLEAIGFGFGHHHPLNGKRIDIIFTPGLNRWQGSEKIQLKIVDLRESVGTRRD
jgi:single-stranded-DNA-specific exonuclease